VDGKYSYNLDPSTLGKRDFQVFIQVGGVNLDNPGVHPPLINTGGGVRTHPR
jgi:hypothetical protein